MSSKACRSRFFVPERQHGGGEPAARRRALQRLLVALVQPDLELHRFATRLLRQQGDLHAVRQREALGAGLEVRGRRLERFAGRHAGIALVVLDHRRDVGRWRRRRAVGFRVRNELTHRAIRGLEVIERHPLHVRGSELAPLIALQEKQPPVAGRDRFGNRYAELLRIVDGLVELAQRLGAHAIHLGRRDRLRAHALDGAEERVARGGERVGERHLRPEDDVARVGQHEIPRLDGARLLRFDERAVQPARGLDGHHLAQRLERDRVRMRARHRVVERGDELRAARTADGDRALAVLHRLLRVERRQRPGGLGNRTERRCDPPERVLRVEPSGDDQHRVVRLIVELVERLQPGDVDVLDVRARADRQVAVVVPVVGRRLQPAPQHALRAVLAALVFVADHGHLGVEVLFRDERIHHPVGLHRERPVEVLLGRGEGLEVVGAVEERRAVEAQPALAELLENAGDRGRPLEQQVLEQVRHAGLAVVLLARAHEIGDVDGRRRLGRVRKEQHPQAVRQRVLGHPFDRGALRHARREGGPGDGRDQGKQDKGSRGQRPGGAVAGSEGHGRLDVGAGSGARV